MFHFNCYLNTVRQKCLVYFNYTVIDKLFENVVICAILIFHSFNGIKIKHTVTYTDMLF